MRRHSSGRRLLIGGLLLIAVILCGCPATAVRRYPVSGRVTLAGRPFGPATLLFENNDLGVALLAEAGPDGAYEVKTYMDVGLAAGTYKVAVTPGPPTSAANATPSSGRTVTPDETGIPRKYHSTATSGLQVEVRDGDNPPFDIDLQR